MQEVLGLVPGTSTNKNVFKIKKKKKNPLNLCISFLCCHDKLPQDGWLKTTDISPFTVLEIQVSAGRAPLVSERPQERGRSALSMPGAFGHPVFPALWLLQSSLRLGGHTASSVSPVCLKSPSAEGTCRGTQGPPANLISRSLIVSVKPLFPNSVTDTGSGAS